MSLTIPTYTNLVTSLCSKLATKAGGLITNFNVGSIARTLQEPVAEIVYELYSFAAELALQGFPSTATGYWLDRHAALLGITRKSSVTAAGVATFTRKSAYTSAIIIPINTLLATATDASGTRLYFFTTAAATLPTGTSSIAVPIIAKAAGAGYNLADVTTLNLSTYIAGIDSVATPSGWLTTIGADEETDTELRARVLAAWATLATGATADTYISWAKAVSGVKSAWVDAGAPRGEGTLNVYITQNNGTTDMTPDDNLILSVQSYIEARRPLCSNALVLAPGTLTFAIGMTVTPVKGTIDTEPISEAIIARIKAWFGVSGYSASDVTALGVGSDLVLSRLVSLVQATSGVYSVTITSLQTSTDDGTTYSSQATSGVIRVDARQIPEFGSVSITFTSASAE